MFRPRQRVGKYRIIRRLARGGFATVYEAYDTIEGIYVALKTPHKELINPETLENFRKEIRLTAGLDHPNILSIKTADLIEDQLVIAYHLGEESLAERMKRRISTQRILEFTEQMLDALAHAHANRIIHCDVKPDNFIIFPGNIIKITDFGIARFATQTVRASGSGTVGYLSPEQALGKPSLKSDVFSLGLIIYEMLSKHLPEWPFDWPPPDIEKLRRKLPDYFIKWLRKALEVNTRKRFSDAEEMQKQFEKVMARYERQK